MFMHVITEWHRGTRVRVLRAAVEEVFCRFRQDVVSRGDRDHVHDRSAARFRRLGLVTDEGGLLR
jgi:hypothetical protein